MPPGAPLVALSLEVQSKLELCLCQQSLVGDGLGLLGEFGARQDVLARGAVLDPVAGRVREGAVSGDELDDS